MRNIIPWIGDASLLAVGAYLQQLASAGTNWRTTISLAVVLCLWIWCRFFAFNPKTRTSP
jgi:hypothetical protein